MDDKWKNFVDATQNRKPINFLSNIIKNNVIERGYALDLGCGAGVDAKYLAENGFKVEAVDFSDVSVKQTKKMCEDLGANVRKEDISNFKIEQKKYSIIISWNSLPFLSSKKAKLVLKNIQKGLVSGGLFVFGIFGPEDDWAKNKKKMSFFSLDEFRKVLSDMKFIEVIEKRETALSVEGENKFWHKITGVAQKM